MRWAASEESKSKQREVDVLKEEIARLAASRDESLESQRRDLTHTFEQLLCQREESFAQREKEIGQQVAALDKRFEQLHTENSRLRSECADTQRKLEAAGEELLIKEESCRHLQWRLDDLRLGKQQTDDSLNRSLQEAKLQLAALSESAKKDIGDVKSNLEKVN